MTARPTTIAIQRKKRIALRATADRVTEQWQQGEYRDQDLLKKINDLIRQVTLLEQDEQAKQHKLLDCLKVN